MLLNKCGVYLTLCCASWIGWFEAQLDHSHQLDTESNSWLGGMGSDQTEGATRMPHALPHLALARCHCVHTLALSHFSLSRCLTCLTMLADCATMLLCLLTVLLCYCACWLSHYVCWLSHCATMLAGCLTMLASCLTIPLLAPKGGVGV